jgi:SOS response regulatory protein OraA/RecX
MTTDARRIERIVTDRNRRIVMAFDEGGLIVTVPFGFRDREMRVGKALDIGDVERLVATGRAWRDGAKERAAARRERATARLSAAPSAGVVTDIAAGRRDSFHISLDGDYAATVTAQALDSHAIRVGRELDAETVAALRAEHDRSFAAHYIDHYLLAGAPRCAADVRRRAIAKGYSRETVDILIAERLRDGGGILSDRDYVTWFMEQKGEGAGKDFRVLVPRLRQLGVSDAAIDAARPIFERDHRNAALETASDKIARRLDLTDRKQRDAFTRRLMARGFGWDVIRAELERLDRVATGLDED